MSAPFFKYGLFGDNVALIVAFAIGIAFGFVLERAGFGNARVLAAQFYFRELRVLKVMFTAIVTAMVGLFLLARAGVVDLSLVYLTPTLVVPQIVGGLVLGAGFIIGGYCPGTSCVSAATGRIDGMVYLAGMVGGLLGFAEVYPKIEAFAHRTPLGQVTLPALLHLPYGVVVAAVVVMALVAFVGAEWAERRFGGREPGPGALLEPTRRITPVRRLALALLAAGGLAAIAGNPYRGPFGRIDARGLALDAARGTDRVSAAQLAESLIAGRSEFLLVDLRDAAAFARYHLPEAVNVPLAKLGPDLAGRNERVLCYADTEADGARAALLLRSLGFSAAYALAGGLQAWRAEVLFPAAPAANADAEEQRRFEQRAAMARHFGGQPQGAGPSAAPASIPTMPELTAPPAATPSSTPAAPRKKKEGC